MLTQEQHMANPTISVTRATTPDTDVEIAAGGILWRQRKGHREFAIVQRQRYNGDYTLPKGKIDPDDETPLAAAIREVREETGWHVEPVEFAGPVTYAKEGRPKLVLYWSMQATHETGKGADTTEVAQVLWLDPKQAIEQLSYPLEREMLARTSGVPLTRATSRLRRMLSALKLRRPAWLRTRREKQLEGAILVTTEELRWRALQTNQTRAPWARRARVLLRAAQDFLRRGMIDEGWQALQTARRLEISVMNDDERAAHATGLRAEADAKLVEWRRKTVNEDLKQTVPSYAALRHAQHIVDEHAQNGYRRLTIAADHLSSMAVIIGLLLVSLLYLSAVVAIPIANAEVDSFELTVYVLIFGMLGGAVSAMLPRDRGGARTRIPEQLSAATFSKLRPVIGGASAVVLYVFVNSGLFVSGIELTQGMVLLFAFAAGFSERLIVRAIARLTDSMAEERDR
jgi:8-oxo-dGTP pyrophosphatase MutT (NUDIX family)